MNETKQLLGEVALTVFDTTCAVWNITSGNNISHWSFPSKITATALTQDGRFAIIGMQNNQAHLIDLFSGHTVKVFEHADSISSVAISENEQYVLIGADDRAARLWDLNSGLLLHQWFYDAKISKVAFSPNNEYAFVSSSQKQTHIRDIKTGEVVSEISMVMLQKITNAPNFSVTAVHFTNDNKSVIIGSPPSYVRQWDIHTGKKLKQWVLPTSHLRPSAAIPFAINTNGNKIIIEASNGTGYVYDF